MRPMQAARARRRSRSPNTVTADDGTVSAVSVTADSLALNGGTIRDAGGRDADLAHPGIGEAATEDALTQSASALTGLVLVDAGGGADASSLTDGASVTLDDPANGSYGLLAAVAADAGVGSVRLALTGAKTVTATDNAAPWSLYGDENGTVAGEGLPAGSYTLSATAYAEADGAGAALGTLEMSFRVVASEAADPDALTASFEGVPEAHDGSSPFTFRVRFNLEPRVSYKVLRDESFAVTGGEVDKARRVDGRNDLREIHIEPEGWDDVAVMLAGGRACGTEGAICTADGKVLANTAVTVVPGPLALSVADARIDEGPNAVLAFQVTLNREAARDGLAALADRIGSGVDRGAWTSWEESEAGDGWMRDRGEGGTRSMTGSELLLGSSFHLALGSDGEGAGATDTRWSAWGRAAASRFDGGADGLSVDGEVTTFTLGADAAWARWLAGVAVSLSDGEGGFRDHPETGHESRGTGAIESTLTSVHPYLRYEASERLSVWGILGYGTGTLGLEVENGERWTTDTAMEMAAAGARGVLVPAAKAGGLELAARTDAQLVRMSSEAATGSDGGNLAATQSETSRLRVMLEGSRAFALEGGGALTPSFEVGFRHDGGDAETGTGIEIGGGLSYTDPATGITVDAKARGLVAHEDTDYAEWGASGSVRIEPDAAGRGLLLSLTPAWGADSGGAEPCGLWRMRADLARETRRSRPRAAWRRRWATASRCSAAGVWRPRMPAGRARGRTRRFGSGSDSGSAPRSGVSRASSGRRAAPSVRATASGWGTSSI